MSDTLSLASEHPLSNMGRWWRYAGFAIVATAGFFYINIMSAIVDGLVVGLHFDNAQAGLVGSANIYGASVGALLAVLIVRHVRWRPTLFALLIILLAIDLASMLVSAPLALAAIRAVHGLVGGTIVGVTYSAMARLPVPQRAFGMLLFVQFGLGGLGVMFLPKLVPFYGVTVLFLTLAVLTLAALLILLTLREQSVTDAVGATRANLSRAQWRSALFLLLALFLFQGGNMGLTAFIVRLGEHYGLTREFISDTLGWATWIGASGAVLVMVLDDRFGAWKPTVLAALTTLLGCALFLRSDSPAAFFLGNALGALAWSFVVPYLFGFISRLDASGHLAALGGLASKLGLASGPLAAGFLLHHDDRYVTLIVLSLIAIGAAMAAAFIGIHRVRTAGPSS
ncbi:MAG: MFS transporter [Proteobacteria bacterium]|uniref:MFS transporter n=1 Tax=Rudaea sp. TaxID=2136325 RepID=UPI0037831B63|nr:MFS transporter [Pseudomonadota bacterium]